MYKKVAIDKRKIGQEKFTERLKAVFGDKFSYSGYINMTTTIEFKCKKHGVFRKAPSALLRSVCGCPKCGYERTAKAKRKPLSKEKQLCQEVGMNYVEYTLRNNGRLKKEKAVVELRIKLDLYGIKLLKYGRLLTLDCAKHGVFKKSRGTVHKNIGDQEDICPKCRAYKRNSRLGLTPEQRGGKPLYHQWVLQLTIEEEPISSPDGTLLVKCAHCRRYFTPKESDVRRRVYALNGHKGVKGEQRIYCSQQCKDNCTVFGFNYEAHVLTKKVNNKKHPDIRKSIRKRVLNRDGHQCIMCGSTKNLNLHHISPVVENKKLINDPENIMTLCEKCHRNIHMTVSGCTYGELANAAK